MRDVIDTIDAAVVKEFIASYLKYPPIGAGGDGDPHCVTCGLTTLDLDDEFDMVAYHVFRCRECQRTRREKWASADTPAPSVDRQEAILHAR